MIFTNFNISTNILDTFIKCRLEISMSGMGPEILCVSHAPGTVDATLRLYVE